MPSTTRHSTTSSSTKLVRDPEAIAPTGLRFVAVDSVGCTQRSQPEADRLNNTYRALLDQRWHNHRGEELEIGVDDS